jgi:hypothetical protein
LHRNRPYREPREISWYPDTPMEIEDRLRSTNAVMDFTERDVCLLTWALGDLIDHLEGERIPDLDGDKRLYVRLRAVLHSNAMMERRTREMK